MPAYSVNLDLAVCQNCSQVARVEVFSERGQTLGLYCRNHGAKARQAEDQRLQEAVDRRKAAMVPGLEPRPEGAPPKVPGNPEDYQVAQPYDGGTSGEGPRNEDAIQWPVMDPLPPLPAQEDTDD